MTSEQRPCPGCHGSNSALRGVKGNFNIYVCRKCKTVFASQHSGRPETENYDNYYCDDNLAVPDFIANRLREILLPFEAVRQTNRLLDIGTGAGTILEVARDLGWEGFGTEVSRLAFETSKAKGFNMFLGFLSDAAFQDEYFDVVTASEIIEHLPDPQSELSEIYRILRPGGLFWGTTPSARSLSFRLLGANWSVISPPEHLQLFSRQAITRMFVRAGFSRVRVYTHGLNPAEILEFYRKRTRGPEGSSYTSRVQTAHELNRALSTSAGARAFKQVLNFGLNAARVGDSMKIFAWK